MHEFSIATALLDLVKRHVPPGGRLRRVVIEAGPLQGIDQQAMEWAWRAATDGGELAGSAVQIIFLRWKLHCPACGNEYAADQLDTPCDCGADSGHPVGGDELRLMSLTVDEPELFDAGAGGRERPEDER